MSKLKLRSVLVVLGLTVLMPLATWAQKSNPAVDPTNEPPPAGAILDLNGTPIPGNGNGSTFQQYTVDFTAALSNTAITFAFREDPAFISFEDASVVDLTTSSGNLLTNGNFAGGTYTDNGNSATPNGWTYANIYGAEAGGQVFSTCPESAGPTTQCWYDGAVQAYDAISQTIPTTVGNTYQISFYLSDNSFCETEPVGTPCLFSDLSTNGNVTGTGGNGIDVLAYAQAGLPPAGTVPEPSSLWMLGISLAGLLGIMRLRGAAGTL